jgi:hypothetical protein
MLIEVRRAMAEDISRVLKFYAAAVAQELDDKGCFCIPYAHLVGCYGGIGFHVMEPAKAPTFLRLRLEKYRDRGDGNDYLIMRREGIQEASDSVRADTSRIS